MIQEFHSWVYIQTKLYFKKIHASLVPAALFTIAKTWKQCKCLLTAEWIKQMWYIYTMEYYSAIKKNELLPSAATWMNLEMTILSEESQTEKDKYHMIPLTCEI